MDVLYETLSFGAKVGFVFLAVAGIMFIMLVAASRRTSRFGPRLEIKRLNDRYLRLADSLKRATRKPKALKAELKQRARTEKKRTDPRRNVYVIDFKGDVMASTVENLRHEVTAVVGAAAEGDEVVVRLESPGGVVPGYGLAASQLARLRERGIKLTVCIDKVAASGGYLMACIADEILAAPFAIVGSIGVAAPVPNFHRFLQNHGVDYEDITAGEFKRTVTIFGEITEKGREKFQEQIEEIHTIFKDWVSENRSELDIDKVATGEYWLARRGKELGLVSELITSDDYLGGLVEEANIWRLRYRPAQSWRTRLSATAAAVSERVLITLWTRMLAGRFQ